MASQSLPTGQTNIYYSSEHTDPDAIVILNRGTQYELDITNDVISFSTSNSIDSSSGSFTLALDNKNDHLVNRFNYSRVKKMSSIEIFSKPLSSFSGGKINSPMGMSTTSTSVRIPEDINGQAPTLNSMFELVYGKDLSPEAKNELKQQFNALNANRVAPVTSGRIDKAGLKAINIDVEVWNSETLDPDLTTNCLIRFIGGTDSGKKAASGAEPIDIGETDNIIFNDNFYLEFTMNDVTLKTPLQNYISVNQAQQSFPLPSDWDASIADDLFRGAPLLFAMPRGMYQRIFFGVVVNVSVQVSPGQGLTVNLNGEGLGYWLKVSYIDTRPGGFEAQQVGKDLTAYSTRFTEMKALDVFRVLISASTDVPTVTNFNIGTDSTESLLLLGKASKNMKNKAGDNLKATDGEGSKTDKNVPLAGDLPTQRLSDLDEKRKNIWRGIGIENATLPRREPNIQTVSGSAKWLELAKKYNSNRTQIDALTKKITDNSEKVKTLTGRTDALERNKQEREQFVAKKEALEKENVTLQDTDNMGGIPEVQSQIAACDVTANNLKNETATLLSEGRRAILKQTGIMDHWKAIFSNIVLEVMDDDVFLQNVYPYSYIMSDPTASLDGEYVSKETIASQIKELLQYEFYFDTNGHFVLKPPFFNMSYDQTNEIYTIEDDQIISFSCNDTVEGMITRISVTGDFREAPGAAPLLTQNIFQDMRLIRDFGFHAKQVGNVNYLHSTSDCRDYGISVMSRNNVGLFNASVTIQGRPGIRCGTPVYFKPRDTVYYIKDISHEFSVGNQHTTTLGLVAGRRMVTGYKTVTKIQSFTREPIDTVHPAKGAKPTYTAPVQTLSAVNVVEIPHYILSDGFNTESIAEYRQAAGIRDSEQEVASEDNVLIGLNAGQTNRVFILRNKYIIIDHYNEGYVGLIIDENSKMIAGINKANFEYFQDLTVSSIPNNPQFGQLLEQQRLQVVNFIKQKFAEFCSGRGSNGLPTLEPEDFITKNNAGKRFTIATRRSFINFFLSASANQILGNSYDQNGASDGKEQVDEKGQVAVSATDLEFLEIKDFPELKLIIERASSIFNLLIANIDRNGLYKQFTDDAGREMAAYQDYGLSLIYESNILKINSVKNTDEISASNLKMDEKKAAATRAKTAAKKAQQLVGVYDPNDKAFKDFVDLKFRGYTRDGRYGTISEDPRDK